MSLLVGNILFSFFAAFCGLVLIICLTWYIKDQWLPVLHQSWGKPKKFSLKERVTALEKRVDIQAQRLSQQWSTFGTLNKATHDKCWSAIKSLEASMINYQKERERLQIELAKARQTAHRFDLEVD